MDLQHQNPVSMIGSASKICDRCKKVVDRNWVSSPFSKNGGFFVYEIKDGKCVECVSIEESDKVKKQKEKLDLERRYQISQFLGGVKPFDCYTFESYNPILNPKAFNVAKDFNPDCDDLFIYGTPGVGKTHLATAIAHAAIDNGRTGKVFSIPSLMRQLRGHRTPDDEDKAIADISRLDVLVLDDLGVGKPTEFMFQILQEILDQRDNAMRHGLIVTSNLDLNTIAEKLGDKIASRLSGMCNKIIKADGEDQRLKRRLA